MKTKIFILMLFIITEYAIAGISIYLDDGESYFVNDTINQDDRFFLDSNTFNDPGTHIQINNNGMVSSLNLYNKSTALISGGIISSSLFANDNSEVIINDGTIGNLHAYGNSLAIIKGGSIGDLIVAGDSSTIYLYGNNFSVGGVDLNIGNSLRDYGIFEEGQNNIDYLTGTIVGTLLDGSAINNRFYIWFNTTADIIIVPEPASMALLGLGICFLRNYNIS